MIGKIEFRARRHLLLRWLKYMTGSSSNQGSAPELRIAENFPAELRFTSRIGIPLAFGELGWMSTYIVDAIMIGRMPHSALTISASSLGNTIFYAIAFCCIGLMTGIETLVAQAYGRGDQNESIRDFAQALWFVVIGTPVVMGITLGSIRLLPFLGTPPDIIAETHQYLNALVWSTAPLLLYWALRRYLQSINRVMLVMISLVTASFVNFAGDWAFLYGHLGLKPFGIAGSGWATCVVRVYTVVLLLLALRMGNKGMKFKLTLRDLQPNRQRLRALFTIGWPAAIESLANLGVSTVSSILCARLGATMLAAHQVVLDLNAFVFMFPLGLSYATAARVGQSAGRNSLEQVRRAANASLTLGLGFISIAALAFASFPHFWASMYTNDSKAVLAAAPIFLLCGILQIGDAAAVILENCLVGLGDTRTPLFANVFWSWGIGMPLSYWLTFGAGMGLTGLWIGRLTAGIGAAATLAILWHLRLGGGRRVPIARPLANTFSIQQELARE